MKGLCATLSQLSKLLPAGSTVLFEERRASQDDYTDIMRFLREAAGKFPHLSIMPLCAWDEDTAVQLACDSTVPSDVCLERLNLSKSYAAVRDDTQHDS